MNGKKITLLLFIWITMLSVSGQLQMKHQTGPWGDQGNGTYINPVLYADYSDPDVIRVGDDFYMVCSEFHFMGIPVLHSKDPEGANQFYFSTDNKKFQVLGQPFPVHNGYWKGPKLGLFSYNEMKAGGIAKFDWFRYDYAGPQKNKLNGR